MRGDNKKCRICQAGSGTKHFCAECVSLRQQAVARLLNGETMPGDAALLNIATMSRRISEDGLVQCSRCRRHRNASDFSKRPVTDGTVIPLHCYCRDCEKAVKADRRKTGSAAPAHNVVHLPRAKPPATDSGRQLRTLLDDLGRTLSRLDSLAARSAPDQFGDEIERRTLASQLSRLATTAIEMTGRLSGIVTTEESDHDRRARVRSIR